MICTVLVLGERVLAHSPRCPDDSVLVGRVCVDKYEASVWAIPSENTGLIARVRAGRATLQDLQAGGAEQFGVIPREGCVGTEYGVDFPRNGNWTRPLYAVSVAGAYPSTCITWFQAEQACRLSRKRLLTNQEWQAAAAGTPDPNEADDALTTCVTASDFADRTGSRRGCVSAWGVHDTIGNVWEWVADWVPAAATCAYWSAEYGGDLVCVGGVGPAGGGSEVVEFDPALPGAIIRGGNFAVGTRNGAFAYFSGVNPHNVSRSTGFRCARD